jgi:hypothetical protein
MIESADRGARTCVERIDGAQCLRPDAAHLGGEQGTAGGAIFLLRQDRHPPAVVLPGRVTSPPDHHAQYNQGGAAKANVELFQQTLNTTGLEFDNLTAFGDVVVALGPPQHAEDTATRKVEI